MSIHIIVGRPGSGKSYESVVYHVIPAIKDGRKVVTNLPLNLEHFKSVFGDEVLDLIDIRKDVFSKEEGVIRAFSKPEHFTSDDWRNDDGQGPLFVVDECHFVYPTSGRGKAANDSLKDCLEYFSMHRHHGHDVILMTQSLGKLNKDLRDMIQNQYAVSKHSAIGSDTTYTQKVLDGASGRPTCVNTNVRTYKKSYFPFYQSHTKSESSVHEAQAKDITPLWKRPFIWVAIVFVLFGLPMTVSQAMDLFGGSAEVEPTPVVKSASEPDRFEPSRQKTKPVKAKSPDGSHPFEKLTLAITGNSDSSYRDNNGRYHRQIDVYFSAESKSKYQFPLSLQDLYMAGYDVAVLGPCLVRLSYQDYEENVFCEGAKPKSDSGGVDLAGTFSSAIGG